jgi:hypothetical protein
MRKLKLNIEAITVESFQTQAESAIRGTVAANHTHETACSCAITECPTGLTECDASDCTACNPTNPKDCTWAPTATGGGGGGTETSGVTECGSTCLEEPE